MNDEAGGTPAPLPGWLDRGLRIAAILGLAALVAVATDKDSGLSVEEAALVGAAILLALAIAAIPLNRLAGATSVKFGPVEVTLADGALANAPTAALGDDGEVGDDVKEIVDLQLLLEAKLAYIAKEVLAHKATGYWSSFLTIGSLQHDKLLSREDAIAARRLLGLKAGDVAAAPKSQRDEYLKDAKPFVGAIRATIFYNLVKKLVGDSAGVEPRELSRGKGRRADLAVNATVGDRHVRILVFPAFAVGSAHWTDAENLRKRARDLAENADAALIVVPANAKLDVELTVGNVAIVDVTALVEAAAGKQPKRKTRLDKLLARVLPRLAESP